MTVEVNNLTATAVNDGLIRKVGEAVLKGEKSKNKNISFVLAGSPIMKLLNYKYRRKNRATDVLTFPDLDILICPKVVRDNAKKYGVSFERELVKVVIHGTLHWLGYDHEAGEKEAEEMRNKEEKYFNEIK